jgi:hypothetical protein
MDKQQDNYDLFFQLLHETANFKKILMEMPEESLRVLLKIFLEVLNKRYL